MPNESIQSRSLNEPLIFNNLLRDVDESSIDWKPFREGIDISRIYNAGINGPSAAFLRYQPGAKLQRHHHAGYEHILILSGSQIDDYGEHFAGTLLVHPPGTSHGIRSIGGCVVLAIWEKPVVFEVE
jgi:anti-sigma factor ChrR (cupin superfamily)